MAKLTDKSQMPFGQYKGALMGNVPAKYLLFLHGKGLNDGPVKTYIIENMDTLKLEVKKK